MYSKAAISSICKPILNINSKLDPLVSSYIWKFPSASVNPLNHSINSRVRIHDSPFESSIKTEFGSLCSLIMQVTGCKFELPLSASDENALKINLFLFRIPNLLPVFNRIVFTYPKDQLTLTFLPKKPETICTYKRIVTKYLADHDQTRSVYK